jgi:hypothetical protein
LGNGGKIEPYTIIIMIKLFCINCEKHLNDAKKHLEEDPNDDEYNLKELILVRQWCHHKKSIKFCV